MSQIFTYQTPQPEPGAKPFEVLASTSVKWDARKIVTPMGTVQVVLTCAFGVDPQTKKRRYFVVPEERLREFISVADERYAEGFRRFDEAAEAANGDDGASESILGKMEIGGE